MGYTLLQWNCRSLNTNATELKQFVSQLLHPPDIICLQETWLKGGLKFTFDGYNIERQDRVQQVGGGVMTLIKQGIPYDVIGNNCTLEAVTVSVKSARNSYHTICNVYHPPTVFNNDDEEGTVPDNSGNSTLTSSFIDMYRGLFRPRHCIVVGDFNAHNTLFEGSEGSE